MAILPLLLAPPLLVVALVSTERVGDWFESFTISIFQPRIRHRSRIDGSSSETGTMISPQSLLLPPPRISFSNTTYSLSEWLLSSSGFATVQFG